MKATIETLTVKLGDKTLTFTLAEAEALLAVLSDRLGPKFSMPKLTERIIERPVQSPIPRDFWRNIPHPEPRYGEVICETPAQLR